MRKISLDKNRYKFNQRILHQMGTNTRKWIACALEGLVAATLLGCALSIMACDLPPPDVSGENDQDTLEDVLHGMKIMPGFDIQTCTVEVTLESIKVIEDQGRTDAKLELEIDASSDGDSVAWPSSGGYRQLEEGESASIGTLVTSFELKGSNGQSVSMCASITEHDSGFNGDDDDGSKCSSNYTTRCDSDARTVNITIPLCKNSKYDDGECKNENGKVKITFSIIATSDSDDKDGDGIPDSEDFCPTDEFEDNLGTKGQAVLVYAYTGDEGFTQFAQEATDLSKAMEDYDYVALLKEEVDVAGITLSQSAINNADVYLQPTRENFFETIGEMTQAGYMIDIWIWGHGSSNGSISALDAKISGDDILNYLSPENSGCGAIPIRMVHSVSCYHSQLHDKWTEVGAKVSLGARDINFYPLQYSKFVKEWNDGATVKEARDEAATARNWATDKYIKTLGKKWSKEYYGKNEDGYKCNVLQKSDCAETYFSVSEYDISYIYDSSESGEMNMEQSSVKLIEGNRNIRKTSTSLYW